MAQPQNVSTLHQSLHASIQPSDRLHITIRLQQELADKLCLPGSSDFSDMSDFSVSGPPHGAAQTSIPRKDMLSSSPISTNLSLRPRLESGPRLIPCSYPACSESFGTGSSRDAHEENSHGASRSTLESYNIAPAVVIAHMRNSGASEDYIRGAYSSPALLEYNCQLMLLEQQNRKRLAMAQTTIPDVGRSPAPHQSALQDYNRQLMLLEQQNKKRLNMAREEQSRHDLINPGLTPPFEEEKMKREESLEAKSAYQTQQMHQKQRTEQEVERNLNLPSLPALKVPANLDTGLCASETSAQGPDYQNSKFYAGPSHQLWLSGPHALQNYETQLRLVEQQKSHLNPASRNLALQDYQMQLMLLEQQNKKRKMMQDAAKAKEDIEQSRKHHKSDRQLEHDGPLFATEHVRPDVLSEQQNTMMKKQMQQSLQSAPAAGQKASAGHTARAEVSGCSSIIGCGTCWHMNRECEFGQPTCQNCDRSGLPCYVFDSLHITSLQTPTRDGPFQPPIKEANSHDSISSALSNNFSTPVSKADDQLAAQRQAIIQRHQVNMKRWQSTQQHQATETVVQEQKPYTPSHASRRFPSRPTQTTTLAAQDWRFSCQASVVPPSHHDPPHHVDQLSPDLHQRSTATRDLHEYIVQPPKTSTPEKQFTLKLPIRPSRKAAEQADRDAEEWSEVERPRERACSEESELFSDGSDAVDLGLEC